MQIRRLQTSQRHRQLLRIRHHDANIHAIRAAAPLSDDPDPDALYTCERNTHQKSFFNWIRIGHEMPMRPTMIERIA